MVKMVMVMKKNHSTDQVGFFEYHMIFFKQLMVFFFCIHAYKKKLETLYQKPKELTKIVVFFKPMHDSA